MICHVYEPILEKDKEKKLDNIKIISELVTQGIKPCSVCVELEEECRCQRGYNSNFDIDIIFCSDFVKTVED